MTYNKNKLIIAAIANLVSELEIDPFDIYEPQYLIERVKEATK